MDGYKIVEFVANKIGMSYTWGGESDAEGYDCSGLTYAAFASQGIEIPRTASQQYAAADKVAMNDLRAGDLIFFSSDEGGDTVSHVGVYIGNNTMIHAPNANSKVKTETLTKYWQNRTVGAGRYGTNTASDIGLDQIAIMNAPSYAADKATGILSNVTTFIVCLALIILAIFLFIKAFDISII